MTIQPGEIIGPYEVKERLGEGGMAAVYKAWHVGLHRYEALKIPRGGNIDPSYVQRLLTEARLAAGLCHPHVVAIHSVSEPGAPVPYFAMEWIEGRDLLAWLKERGRLTVQETVRLLEPVAAALDYAHERGVIHRDIKPANILLQENPGLPPTPKVVDFGISRAAGEDDGATRLTRSGMFVGTPEYMSPEQSGSGAEVERFTDLYSLGVLAYEMLCGVPPFTVGSGVSRLAILVQHVRDTPPCPSQRCPGVPPAAGEAVLRALAKAPEDRYPTCCAFIAALSRAAEPEFDETGATIMIPAPAVGGLLSAPPAPAPRTNEMTPFDATRFAIEDVATLVERPVPQTPVGIPQNLTTGTRPQIQLGADTQDEVLNEATLQMRLPAEALGATAPVAVAEPIRLAPPKSAPEPQPEPEPDPLPKSKVFSQPVLLPAESPGQPASHSSAIGRSAMVAGFGGVLAGAVIVFALMGRFGGGAPTQPAPAPMEKPPVVTAVQPETPPKRVEPKPAVVAKPVLATVRKRRVESIPFQTVTQQSDSRPAGTKQVLQYGRSGQREVIVAISMRDGQEVSRKAESNRVVLVPQDQIVVVGTQKVVAPRPVRRVVKAAARPSAACPY